MNSEYSEYYFYIHCLNKETWIHYLQNNKVYKRCLYVECGYANTIKKAYLDKHLQTCIQCFAKPNASNYIVSNLVEAVTHSAGSGEVYALSSTLSHVTAEEPHAHALQVLWGDLQNISHIPLSILAGILSRVIICIVGIVHLMCEMMFACHLSTDCGLQRIHQLGRDANEVVMVGLQLGESSHVDGGLPFHLGQMELHLLQRFWETKHKQSNKGLVNTHDAKEPQYGKVTTSECDSAFHL